MKSEHWERKSEKKHDKRAYIVQNMLTLRAETSGTLTTQATNVSETKYIFVTGGVASSLGKGIIAASIGKLLQARGFNITIQK